MERREIILGAGSIVLAAIAGCTGDSNSGSTPEQSTATDQNNTESQNRDQELPPPNEINYNGFVFGDLREADNAQAIGEAGQFIVEELDRGIYNSAEGFPDETERNLSPSGTYVSIEKVGTETRDPEYGESHEQDHLSLDIDLSVNGNLGYDSAEDLAIAVYEIVGEASDEVLGQNAREADTGIFYDPEFDEGVKGSAVSEVSLNIESESGSAELDYQHPDEADDGQSVVDLSDSIDSYLEGSDGAIEEEISEDFNFN